MLRKLLLILAALLVVVAGVFYVLGRGRVEQAPGSVGRTPALGEDVRLAEVRLYFAAPNRIALVPEERIVTAGSSLTERIASCIRELAAGSLTGKGSVLPPGVRLTKAFVDPWGTAYLDLDRAILGERILGDGEEWLVVGSIVRTICDNFPEVREVRFMVDGQVVTSLGGYVDLEEPLGSEDFPAGADTP